MKSHLNSSFSARQRKRQQGRNRAMSMTSSSDVAVEVEKARRENQARAQRENGTTLSPADRISEEGNSSFAPLAAMYLGSHDSQPPSQHTSPGAGSSKASPRNSKVPEKPPPPTVERRTEVVPPSPIPKPLIRLPPLVRNLLMGAHPIPPAPSLRVLRLYVAADDADSLSERLTLAKTVFPRLRVFAEELGWHLEIMDSHWPLSTHSIPPSHLHHITTNAMNDDIALWLIFLNDKLGWSLPASIVATDFTDICSRLDDDEESKSLLHELYTLDENNVPPAYVWSPHAPSPFHSSALCVEVKKALSRRTRNSGSIIVVSRELTDLPCDTADIDNETVSNPPDLAKYLDLRDKVKDERLQGQLQRLKQTLEEKVAADCVLRWTVQWPELLAAQASKENGAYLTSLCERVEHKLKAAISGIAADQTYTDRFLASGVPPTLCQELLMHAHRRQDLCSRCPHPPPIVSTAIAVLDANPHTPLLIDGPPGCDLETVASHIAQELSKDPATGIVALRFLGTTPDSHSLLGSLFGVLEQVSITVGDSRFKDLQCLTCADVLSCIAACATNHPITIVLSDLQDNMLRKVKGQWPPHNLSNKVRVVTLTSDRELVEIWSQQLPAECVLEIPPTDISRLEKIFTGQLARTSRCLTNQQHSAAVAAIDRCPHPVFAMLMASLAGQWTSDRSVSEEEIPDTVEAAVDQVLTLAEDAVGKDCVSRVLSYITLARCGLSDGEMDDVLAMDDTLVLCLYPQTPPALCRASPFIWLYLKTLFRPYLEAVTIQGRRVYRWEQQCVGSAVRRRYLADNAASENLLHAVLADYFMGRWAHKPKLFNDPTQEREVLLSTYVMPQPDSYGPHGNQRKFSCLLHHLLHGSTQTAAHAAVRRYLYDVSWMVRKLDSTSVIQLLDDLRTAKFKVPETEDRLTWLQMTVSRSATSLSVSGRHLHTCLYSCLVSEGVRTQGAGEQKEKKEKKDSKSEDLQAFKSQLMAACMNSSTPSLFLHHPPPRASTPTTSAEAGLPVVHTTISALNGLYPATSDGRFVVSISRMAGEIVVWDTTTHTAVRTLRGVDQPHDLAFLDERHVLVLCNRELKTYDLDSGRLVSKLRGMLNLKMPYFRVRDPKTVIVLARNRMSVNVMDVHTGHIHATFKAGEDRFLDSLIVSRDGRVLVCGDETQKPFPLLVWELGEWKLLHDLRLPQHEFITSIASITHDGQYIACACKELDAPGSNFIVVYDLTSGQLYRRLKMAASVTCLAVASSSMAVVMVMDDGSMASFNLVSGSCNFHVSGVRAVYNRVQLSSDESHAVTYSVDAGTLPSARTLALWDLHKGEFVASYTSDCLITCCRHVTHNNSVLVGLAGNREYVILSLSAVPGQTTGQAGLDSEDVHFGNPELEGRVFD
nr:hypothetical protein BaRGS_021767 [Batillaria attramentaria]